MRKPFATPAPRASDVLAKMAKAYTDARFYRDTGAVTTVFPSHPGSTGFTTVMPFQTSFVRDAGLFRFEYADDKKMMGKSRYVVWSNGIEVRTWWTIRPVVKTHKDLQMALAGAAGVSGGSATGVPHQPSSWSCTSASCT